MRRNVTFKSSHQTIHFLNILGYLESLSFRQYLNKLKVNIQTRRNRKTLILLIGTVNELYTLVLSLK